MTRQLGARMRQCWAQICLPTKFVNRYIRGTLFSISLSQTRTSIHNENTSLGESSLEEKENLQTEQPEETGSNLSNRSCFGQGLNWVISKGPLQIILCLSLGKGILIC